MEQEIRVATAKDADRPIMVRLYRQLCAVHGADYSMEEAGRRLERILSAPYICNILLEGQEAIGSAIWMEMGDHVFLRHFTIDESLRRSGMGSRAFRALDATYFSGREIELSATNLVTGPREFWGSLGFEQIGMSMRRDARH